MLQNYAWVKDPFKLQNKPMDLFFLLELIYSVVLVSAVQKSDSVIRIHVSILFQILFPFRLLQSIEQSFLCYTVGPCWLSILFYLFFYVWLH